MNITKFDLDSDIIEFTVNEHQFRLVKDSSGIYALQALKDGDWIQCDYDPYLEKGCSEGIFIPLEKIDIRKLIEKMLEDLLEKVVNKI